MDLEQFILLFCIYCVTILSGIYADCKSNVSLKFTGSDLMEYFIYALKCYTYESFENEESGEIENPDARGYYEELIFGIKDKSSLTSPLDFCKTVSKYVKDSCSIMVSKIFQDKSATEKSKGKLVIMDGHQALDYLYFHGVYGGMQQFFLLDGNTSQQINYDEGFSLDIYRQNNRAEETNLNNQYNLLIQYYDKLVNQVQNLETEFTNVESYCDKKHQ